MEAARAPILVVMIAKPPSLPCGGLQGKEVVASVLSHESRRIEYDGQAQPSSAPPRTFVACSTNA